MPRPSHYFLFYHPHNTGWAVQIMKLLIMKFSPFPCDLVPLRPKYSPKYPILKPLQPTFLPQCILYCHILYNLWCNNSFVDGTISCFYYLRNTRGCLPP
jgi:hypothetical protein